MVGLTVVFLSIATRDVGWIRLLYPFARHLGLPRGPALVRGDLSADGRRVLAEAVGKDLLGKVATGQESHGAPPLTHLAAALGTFWPLSAFMVLALPA
ncbi:MAG: hypothetical protein HPM95_15455 [Alphaproteobacteria bacterium]|nr:hypothetical protein [Alphaproteobacteria bacterium]